MTHMFLVVLIMVWRDILVDGIRMMCAERGVVVAAGLLGKAKTVVQMVAIVFVLLNNLPRITTPMMSAAFCLCLVIGLDGLEMITSFPTSVDSRK